MAKTRIESSYKRLYEKINEEKENLKNNRVYDINELSRLKKNLEKKKLQYEKDLFEYESTEEKDEEKLIEYEDLKTEEDVFDDIEHYIEVIIQEKLDEERAKIEEREAEAEKIKLEPEKLRIEANLKKHTERVQVEKEIASKTKSSKTKT